FGSIRDAAPTVPPGGAAPDGTGGSTDPLAAGSSLVPLDPGADPGPSNAGILAALTGPTSSRMFVVPTALANPTLTAGGGPPPDIASVDRVFASRADLGAAGLASQSPHALAPEDELLGDTFRLADLLL